MGQQTLSGTDISTLREEYLRKVTEELPSQAKTNSGWPISEDHCFARVVLDNLFENEWSNHIDGSPAYRHLTADQLQSAISIADRMLVEGRPAVETLNQRSLQWRNWE